MAGLALVVGDVLVQVVEPRAAAGDDQSVRQNACAVVVREVLAHDGLVDLDSVRYIKEGSAREERRMKGGEAIAVAVHKGEQSGLDQLRVLHRRHAKRLEDHAGGQACRALELEAVEVLQL